MLSQGIHQHKKGCAYQEAFTAMLLGMVQLTVVTLLPLVLLVQAAAGQSGTQCQGAASAHGNNLHAFVFSACERQCH